MKPFAHKITVALLGVGLSFGSMGPTPAQTLAEVAQTPALPSISADRIKRLRGALQRYVDEGRLAGVVVQVQLGGRTVVFEAVGWRDREARAPMRQDTIFRIASQTKAITSVAIMMLMEEGALLLDDPVGKYLPEWTRTTVAIPTAGGGYEVVPAARPITIRDLLTHRSGVPYGPGPADKAWREAGIYGWYFGGHGEPVSAVVARMATLPMAAHPGAAFHYGYSTDILGVVVEKVSGQSLRDFLDARLVRPLGMKDTSFYLDERKADRLAAVYGDEGPGLRRAPDADAAGAQAYKSQGHYRHGPRLAQSGGSGLLSTAADYSRFLEMMRRGGELDGRRYLSRKSVQLMLDDQLGAAPRPAALLGPGQGFGLGFSVRTGLGAAGMLGSVGEFGWSGAYHSQYWVDPAEQMTVVYLTQLLPAGDIDDHGKVRALIYQALN